MFNRASPRDLRIPPPPPPPPPARAPRSIINERSINFKDKKTLTRNTELFWCPLCLKHKRSPFTYKLLIEHLRSMHCGTLTKILENPYVKKRYSKKDQQRLKALACIYADCGLWINVNPALSDEDNGKQYRDHVYDHLRTYMASIETIGEAAINSVEGWYHGFPCGTCQAFYFTQTAAKLCCFSKEMIASRAIARYLSAINDIVPPHLAARTPRLTLRVLSANQSIVFSPSKGGDDEKEEKEHHHHQPPPPPKPPKPSMDEIMIQIFNTGDGLDEEKEEKGDDHDCLMTRNHHNHS